MLSWRLHLCWSLALAGALPLACSSGAPPATGAGGAATGGGATHTSSSTASSSSGLPLTPTFTVSGVVTDGTSPVEGAIVMQGGAGVPAMITGPDGAYSITLTEAIPGTPTVVATKLGYRTEGVEIFSLPVDPVEIALRQVTLPDNPGYVYGDPGTGETPHDTTTAYCGHCHITLVKQFQGSAHAASARSPLVQDLYAGVSEAHADPASCAAAGGVWRAGLVPGAPATTTSKCYLGGGVLPDLNPGCGGPGQLALRRSGAPRGRRAGLLRRLRRLPRAGHGRPRRRPEPARRGGRRVPATGTTATSATTSATST